MVTIQGWLFFSSVVALFSWGIWMGFMGMFADHESHPAPQDGGAATMGGIHGEDLALWPAA